ncbi:M28 family metallopeptidase [Pseudonocardia acaciae]|uniref:M28 family metallopeptidase n=1 Tax=Pseudonocardia acaciae TaxID=551276 RepID=UPI000686491D|nr:M28 family metallopeptidase [Pseudonocardia acaciae]
MVDSSAAGGCRHPVRHPGRHPGDAGGPRTIVSACIDALSAAAYRADLEALVAHTTRYSTGDGFAEALRWADDQLTAAGYRTHTQRVPVDGATSFNLVAERPGTGPDTRGVVVVTAHLDSINLRGGPAAPAPGADDNASGCAGLLSMARALAGATARLDLRLILFGGEEEGLFGSKEYVRRLPVADRGRIRAVVNMDMIGHSNTPAPEVLLEGAAVSADVIEELAQAAATYTTLAVSRSYNPYNSDHVPFIDVGIPAVLTIEGADSANTAIHSAADTLDTVDTALALEIVRMNTAFTAGALDITG